MANLLPDEAATFETGDPADYWFPFADSLQRDTTRAHTGTASWFRLVDSDGSVTATGGGGDLTLNTTTISIGLTVEITSGQITMPAGSA